MLKSLKPWQLFGGSFWPQGSSRLPLLANKKNITFLVITGYCSRTISFTLRPNLQPIYALIFHSISLLEISTMVLQLLNIRVGIGQSLLENSRKRKPSSQNCHVRQISSRVSWCSSCAAKRPWMCQAENTSDWRACKKSWKYLKYVVLSCALQKRTRFKAVIPESPEVFKVVVFKTLQDYKTQILCKASVLTGALSQGIASRI